MSDEAYKKLINEDIELESLLSDEDLEYLDIIDEKTGDRSETIEFYEGFIRLIGSGVALSHQIKKVFNEQSNRLNTSLLKNNDELKAKMKDTLIKGLKCDESISKNVMGLYDYCEKTKRYWHNCSLELYEYYYPHLMKAYLEKFSNSTELDFLKGEYEFFLLLNTENSTISPTQNLLKEKDDLGAIGYFDCLFIEEKEFFKIETQKKLDFISNKLLDKGFYIQIAKHNDEIILNLIPEKQNDFEKLEEEVLEVAQLPKFSLIERFELLEKIGFQGLLKNINADKKSLNKLLAVILGCSVVNARKLLDGTYKVKNKEQKMLRQKEINQKINDFMFNNDIKVNSTKS